MYREWVPVESAMVKKKKLDIHNDEMIITIGKNSSFKRNISKKEMVSDEKILHKI